MITNGELLFDVKHLNVSFKTDEGMITAVNDVSFQVERGQTLGIVGESGSGKSVTAKSTMLLLPRNAVMGEESSMRLFQQEGHSTEITKLNPFGSEIRDIRGGEISMIFQEPMASFSPVHTIGNQISEAILAHQHKHKTQKEAKTIAIDMLDRVGISNPALRYDQYSFELSGGMRQRAMIAVALATRPSLLIADEPTTALDVTIQAQILDLMKELQEEMGMAIIFITHDLGVIAQVADEVLVMYLGNVMEQSTVNDILIDPHHPYTQNLLKAIPHIDFSRSRLDTIPGDIPSPLERPTGCPFHTRCTQAVEDVCSVRHSQPIKLDGGRIVDCILYDDVV
jgi:peptide/nickel transport system ATP-binding protein